VIRSEAAAAGCLAAQLILALALIPPWQNPDEPQHLMTTRLILTRGPDFVVESTWGDPSEALIVASMVRYGWWRHYGEPTPDPLPSTFAAGPAKVVGDYFGPPGGGSRLYYRAVAALFRTLGTDDVLRQLYAMRGVSAIAALLTIWCVWAGARALLDPRAALVITALVALHPQFVLVSTTASPDALVNLAGAVVWWQSALLLASGVTVASLAMLWIAAAMAFVIRRMGAPLLVVSGAVTIFVVSRDLWLKRAWRSTLAAVAAGAVLLVVAAPMLGTDASRALGWIQFDRARALSTIAANSERLGGFFEMMFRTFWLAAGWLRYVGPPWWHAVTVALCAVAAIGLVRLVATRRHGQAFWLSIGAASLQIAAVVAYYFGILQSGPQGRYLFPVLPAIFCLLWLGWHAAVGGEKRPAFAALSLVVVMAVLNTSAWAFVILPAYVAD
jgi:hypothetical protein